MAPTSKTPSEPLRLRAVPDLARPTRARSDERLRIGRAMQVNGEVIVDTDLSIDGRVSGRIDARNHRVIIGVHGSAASDVIAGTVLVLGEVRGNIVASQKVDISPTGTVHGDIRAPRVVLADGATVQGSINRNGATQRPGLASKPAPHGSGREGGTICRVPFWSISSPGQES